jgi:hypothetical protein
VRFTQQLINKHLWYLSFRPSSQSTLSFFISNNKKTQEHLFIQWIPLVIHQWERSCFRYNSITFTVKRELYFSLIINTMLSQTQTLVNFIFLHWNVEIIINTSIQCKWNHFMAILTDSSIPLPHTLKYLS